MEGSRSGLDGIEVGLGPEEPEVDGSGGSWTPPPPPTVPPPEPGGSGSPRRPVRFAPWFVGIALLVGLERVAMLLVGSDPAGGLTRAWVFAGLCGAVLGVMTVGGWLFWKGAGR